MKNLFDSSLYQFDTPQPSYWEATAGNAELQRNPLAGAHSCDAAIIGSVYTGLSAMLQLARNFNIYVANNFAPVLVFVGCGVFSISGKPLIRVLF